MAMVSASGWTLLPLPCDVRRVACADFDEHCRDVIASRLHRDCMVCAKLPRKPRVLLQVDKMFQFMGKPRKHDRLEVGLLRLPLACSTAA